MFPVRCPRVRRTDEGNFGKFRYGEMRVLFVEEHANVPCALPRVRRTDEGNFGKFCYGEMRVLIVAEHANVPCALPPRSPDR